MLRYIHSNSHGDMEKSPDNYTFHIFSRVKLLKIVDVK